MKEKYDHNHNSDRLVSEQRQVRDDHRSMGHEGQEEVAKEASNSVVEQVRELAHSHGGNADADSAACACESNGGVLDRHDAIQDPPLQLLSSDEGVEVQGHSDDYIERLSPDGTEVCSVGQNDDKRPLSDGNDRAVPRRGRVSSEQKQRIAELKNQLQSALKEIERLEAREQEYRDAILLIISHTDPHLNTNHRVLLEIKAFLNEYEIPATFEF